MIRRWWHRMRAYEPSPKAQARVSVAALLATIAAGSASVAVVWSRQPAEAATATQTAMVCVAPTR